MDFLSKMNNANRVIFNSAVLYIKIIINVLISLVSVPIIMHALGNSDYGLYNLIAGVIGLLAFIKSAMAVSTQRFISVAIGENRVNRINNIFNSSLALHLMIGMTIVLLFEIAVPFLFNGFLIIDEGRENAAKIIYQFLVVSTFIEISCVPYEGLMNAKEDLFFFSIIGILSALFKLLLAFYLRVCPFDRLVVYGLGMTIISFATILSYVIFTRMHYKSVSVNFIKYFDRNALKEIVSFTGWNTFGAIALVGRNQGVAVVINRFFGTVLNAAYGIANQVNGVMSYFSNSFHKAITPQLMKSHGEGDDERMLKLAMISSKFSVIVMAFFSVPLVIEMAFVMNVWLINPPDYTVELCNWILILSLLSQYSIGLMNSISATGQIKKYQLVMSVLILLNVPISYVLLKLGYPPYFCTIGFVLIELISLVVRIIMAHSIVGINIKDFIGKVIKPTIICITLSFLPAYAVHFFLPYGILRTIIVFISFMTIFLITAWLIALEEYEKKVILNLMYKIKSIVK